MACVSPRVSGQGWPMGVQEGSQGVQHRNHLGDKMSDLRKAAQTALEAWDRSRQWPFPTRPDKEFDALRAAVAQPERKPLTEDEIELAYREIWRDLSDGFSHTSAEWIEAGIRYAEKMHGIE